MMRSFTVSLLTGLKIQIVTELSQQDIIISTIKQMPESIKLKIVKKAKVKSAEDREREFESELGSTTRVYY